jgi:hypothetical protein
LRESVIATQDMGMQVVLMAFSPTPKTGRSAALVQEVDEVIVLDRSFWEPCFTPNEPRAVAAIPPAPAEISAAAQKYVSDWSSGATMEEITHLLDQAPRVPKDIDVQLVISAEDTLGSLRDQVDTKVALRQAFWKALRAARKESAAAHEPLVGAE